MGENVHSRISGDCRRNRTGELCIQDCLCRKETFRNQWIFSLLLRIGDNGERSYLRTGSAGGRNSDKSDIIKTSYAGSKLTDGFGWVDGGTAAHCHDSLRLIIHDCFHSGYHFINGWVRNDILKYFKFNLCLIQAAGDHHNHTALHHERICDDHDFFVRYLSQAVQRTVAVVNLGFNVKTMHTFTPSAILTVAFVSCSPILLLLLHWKKVVVT